MNVTALPPYAVDLLLVVPRLAQRAGAIAFYYLPDQFDGVLKRIRHPGSVIAEATEAVNSTVTNATINLLQSTAASAAPAATSTMQGVSEGTPGIFSLQNLRGMGGFVSYITSRWAITTVLVSLLLNRTLFYASSRMPLTLRWHVRVALYLAPIFTLLYQTRWLLQAMRCQTSPQWSMLRYHNPEKRNTLDYAGEGGVLYYLASTLTYWQDDYGACSAVNMVPLGEDPTQHQGSLPLLWPAFLTFCFSQFIETIACAVQGRQPKPEVGMTLFEHSLAYSEAEALITKPLDLGLAQAAKAASEDGKAFTLPRYVFLQKMNVPPEVLLLSLISSLSHLSSHVLAVLGWRSRLRLVNTGTWALAYMCMFIWSFIRLVSRKEDADDLGIFRIPTVILVGFIPHITILLGLAACGLVYGLALLLTMLSLPPGVTQPRTFKERLLIAYENLQANVQLSAGGTPLRIDWQEDFYTALLKAGFTLLTAASEAVYLNQGSKIRVSPMTWLEERRIAEITRNRGTLYQRTLNSIPSELHNGAVAEGTTSADVQAESRPGHISHSGYARERRTRKVNGSLDLSTEAGRARGVGFAQRHSRWSLSLAFSKGIFWLIAAFNARLLVSLFDKLGIAYSPQWLRKLAGDIPHSQKNRQVDSSAPTGPLQFWMLSENGELTLPKDNNIDVEAETRRRFEDFGLESKETEEAINENLYGWWKFGGWWGEVDTSGDYQQQEQDDDLTSVTSLATEIEDSEAWSDVEENGQRTPTQQNPFPSSRESTPLAEDLLDNSRLATLLDPQTLEQQEEAHMLARHLRSNRILTRSQYSKDIDRERARILTSSRAPPGRMQPFSNTVRTPEGEERALEQYILSRRSTETKSSTGIPTGTWDTGAEGMGSGGPSCVVCQSSPRTILVWPCGCLSLCDDCRVGLAMRNFASCVCCRTDVVAYSRLYVP